LSDLGLLTLGGRQTLGEPFLQS